MVFSDLGAFSHSARETVGPGGLRRRERQPGRRKPRPVGPACPFLGRPAHTSKGFCLPGARPHCRLRWPLSWEAGAALLVPRLCWACGPPHLLVGSCAHWTLTPFPPSSVSSLPSALSWCQQVLRSWLRTGVPGWGAVVDLLGTYSHFLALTIAVYFKR